MISVVIPCYRPDARLRDVLQRLSRVLPPAGAEIIIVDDGNPPHVAADIRAAAHAATNCRVLRFERNHGQQRATLAGIRAARGRVIVTMDDDGGHPPEILPRMLAALEGRTDRDRNRGAARRPAADLVYGVPSALPTHGARALGSRVNRAVFRLFLGVPRCDAVTSFRAFHAELLTGHHRKPLRTWSPRPSSRPALPPNTSALLLARSPRVTCMEYRPVRSHLTRNSPVSLTVSMAVLIGFWAPRGLLMRALGRVGRGGRAGNGITAGAPGPGGAS